MPKTLDVVLNKSIETLQHEVQNLAKMLEHLGGPHTSFHDVSFWLEKANSLGIVEEYIELKDISDIKSGQKVVIELRLALGDMTYKLVLRTIVGSNGMLQLTHPEVTEVDFPYAESPVWEKAKEYAKRNAIALAQLALSCVNTALTLMKLK